jgi:hypothetical protein
LFLQSFDGPSRRVEGCNLDDPQVILADAGTPGTFSAARVTLCRASAWKTRRCAG